ncbi:unnamed protein product [Urochloa humidicola]
MAAGRTPAPTARRRRRGRGWSTPKNSRPPRSPFSQATEPPPLPLLPRGTDVEVRLDGDGYFGTWYEATVAKSTPAPPWYTVRYADLRSNNGRGSLSEHFAPTHVRPRPPPPPPDSPPPRFLPHDAVEAFDKGGWWSGIVLSASDASVAVAFPITREVLQFPPNLVRPRRDYLGGGEWAPSASVVAVRPEGAVRVYEVGEKVEVGRSSKVYEYSWFPATVVKVIDDLSYIVEFTDLEVDEEGDISGDKATEYEYLHWQFIRPAVEHSPLESEFQMVPGAAVEVNCDGAWSAGVVRRTVGDGEFEVSINGKQQVTKAIEFLKPRYIWDGEQWTIWSAKRKAGFRRTPASGKHTRSNKVSFSDDEHGHDLEYSGVKKTRKELPQQVTALDEGSHHASVSRMDTPLSGVENSPASIDPPNSSSPLHGCSTALKTDGFDNNQLQRKSCKVYTSKKITSKKKKCLDEPDNLQSSLESPTTIQNIGVNETAKSQRESPLTQLLDRTEETINTNEVTCQEPFAMVPWTIESASDDIDDVQRSKLDEGLNVPTRGHIQNRHDDVIRSNNTATEVPFVKTTLQLWSVIDEMDIFKEFPQQPHFLPLQRYLPELREEKAVILMLKFSSMVKSIRKSSIADNERSFEEEKSVLAELKTHGFDVHCFETLLDELIKRKLEYTKHLEELESVKEQKLGPTSCLAINDSLLCGIDEEMAKLDQAMGQLRRKTHLIEKENEDHFEKISKLNVVESSVKKALVADEQQFNSILVDMLQKQLT